MRYKKYESEEERLIDTFDLDIQEGTFGEWKKGLSPAAYETLSEHDMKQLSGAFRAIQIETAKKVESHIALKCFPADGNALLRQHAGQPRYPWLKEVNE